MRKFFKMAKYVFVYGTLMSGEGNSRLMETCGGKFHGNGEAYGVGVIQKPGLPYPYLIATMENYSMYAVGEVYEFPDDANISPIEGMERGAGYSSIIRGVTIVDDKGEPTGYLPCIMYIIPGYYFNDDEELMTIDTDKKISGMMTCLNKRWSNLQAPPRKTLTNEDATAIEGMFN